METVPQEIFLAILDSLKATPRRMRRLMTVSRRWLQVIERSQSRFESLTITNTDMPVFSTLFRPTVAHRKALVKEVELKINLPEYDAENYNQHEEANNQIFSTAVLDLFRVLETFNEDEDVIRNARKGDRLHLRISYITSPSDKYNKDHRGTYIKLLNHEKLPTLSCVSRFDSGHCSSSRKLDPASGILIASKLKDLGTSYTDYYDNRVYVSDETRKIMRSAFASALAAYSYSLGEFRLGVGASFPLDEASILPNYVPSSSRVDPMNLAMHEFIQRTDVSEFNLSCRHVISPGLFWPYDDTLGPIPTPLWPNLKEVQIFPVAYTPDGNWYFMGDPNIASHSEFIGANRDNDTQELHDTDDTDNIFRSIPIPERMNPLLIAMARAVRFAPSLEQVDLRFGEIDLSPRYVKVSGIKRQFDVYYRARGTPSPFYEGPLTQKPSLICEVQDWRLDKGVEKLWMEALGPDGEIVYH
ncbi:hypothetical protein FQN49_003694 [Arthroderma sp. PD_2]|nr:hypothetical protein FQN49_003694 [Arthroderma sp. PD_2]